MHTPTLRKQSAADPQQDQGHATLKGLRHLRRKLHRWELLHLRQHTEELHLQLEKVTTERDRALQELALANDLTEHWREEAFRQINQLTDACIKSGLVQKDQIVLLDIPSAQQTGAAS